MNILLTGEINTGKSTIVNRYLQTYSGTVGGFRTIRIQTDDDAFFGVYILDINDKEKILSKKNKVGDCFADKSLVRYCEVFDTLGIKVMTFNNLPNLIVMDELGVIEKNSFCFQKKVHECLDSNIPVIGVIKNKQDPFLDSIRQRNDVKLINVDKYNRDAVFERITKMLV